MDRWCRSRARSKRLSQTAYFVRGSELRAAEADRLLRASLEPRTKSIYSDLGFILLGLLVEQVGGARVDELFERITRIGTVHLEPAEHANTYRTVSESPFGFGGNIT